MFPVEKEQKYELHFKPILQSDEKSKEITLKVDASKYHDDTENIKKLAEQYVSQVFLNKTTAADKENKLKLNNDLGKEHNDFNQQFSARLKKEFTEYVPSDAELCKAVKTANQKKSLIYSRVKNKGKLISTIYFQLVPTVKITKEKNFW